MAEKRSGYRDGFVSCIENAFQALKSARLKRLDGVLRLPEYIGGVGQADALQEAEHDNVPLIFIEASDGLDENRLRR
jgi:hypothetical protein